MRSITILEETGNRRTLAHRGRLNLLSHKATLNALEKQALRFSTKQQTQNQRDASLVDAARNAKLATLPVPDQLFSDTSSDDQGISNIVRQQSSLLNPLGVIPGSKADGVTRLFYENVNGIATHISGNEKLEKVKGILDDMEVDLFAFNEHKINFAHRDNKKNGLAKLFNGGETLTRAVGGNLKHPVAKTLGRKMEGGTGMIAYGELASVLRMDLSGMDCTGLARWSYMTFSGRDQHITTVLVGYNPCRTTPGKHSTSYQLQRAYWTMSAQETTCPRKKFTEDLMSLLIKWRQEGRRLIICLDANDNVYNGPLGKALVSHPDLDLKETMLHQTGSHLTATHFRGSRPIDAIWSTPDIEIHNICAMPIGYGIGDHRSFFLDISTRSMVGTDPQPIKRPSARRLNTKIPYCSDNYTFLLERQLIHHRIIQKLRSTHQLSSSPLEIQAKLDAIDATTSQLMHHAEKNCRKIKSGRIPFSPEASFWIKRTLCYRALLRYWAGKIRNRGNLLRQARRCKIDHPFSLSIQTITDRLKVCKDRCKYFMKYGRKHRKAHLLNKLGEARDKQDELAEKRILQIIRSEQDRSFWRRLNWALGKRQGTSVRNVQIEEGDGSVVEYDTQSEVQQAIWDKIHRERYHLAEEAPICQDQMRRDFGYNADTPSGTDVLEGLYTIPPGSHAGTQLLFDSIARIHKIIPKDSINPIITRSDWQYTWQQKQETTSSSQSGLHFGHYVSGATSDLISDVHALKVSIALHHGVALSRWKRGLCVMIEKAPGVKLISKLRAILLMEADFNAANKIIFGQRMLNNVRQSDLMPDEIFSEKQRMAEDGILAKVLFYDISRQLRAPAALASVDAANCYDRVAHAIASLVFRAMGARLPMTLSMLTAIQQMQFFLRTAFGDSKNAVGSKIHLKTQGFMQGNGASPAGWTVVSIVILGAHKEEGHGASFICPVSQTRKDLACILYVDDNDLLHLQEDETSTMSDAQEALQASVSSWGNLLISTGGALKPQKCFYYVIGYEWDRNGNWKYSELPAHPTLITVPLPTGLPSTIQQLSVHVPSTTLGGTTSPSGPTCTLSALSSKAIEWASLARNSGLRPRDFHVSVSKKFWPKLRYGLCANTSSFQDMVSAMHRPYFWMAPVAGLIRSAKRELRYLDTGFYGLGFPHWGIEAAIEAYKKFYQHFGTGSVVGTQLQMSVEILTCELGLSAQPFLLPYEKYGSRATDCFVKSLWEKLDRFQLKLILDLEGFALPREHDRWIMAAFEQIGYSLSECKLLNQVRLHQQVLFESDIFEADGRTINGKFLQPRQLGTAWSTYKFGKQKPIPHAFNLWREAISHLTPGGRRNPKLGTFLRSPHILWSHRYDPEEDVIVATEGEERVLYQQQESSRRGRNTPFTRRFPIEPIEEKLHLCSTRTHNSDTVTLASHIAPAPPTPIFSHFHEVIRANPENHWWEDLKYTGNGLWLYTAIRQGTLIGVSDGSYIKELHTNVCSAAVILECSESGERLTMSITDVSPSANAFRGELLGLLALHLILHSIHKSRPVLAGSVEIFSDCTGALKTVSTLKKSRIPATWRHTDILKVLALQGKDFPFRCTYHHVKAHQDDNLRWDQLSRVSQLNCACDAAAKKRIHEFLPTAYPQRPLPHEKVMMIVENIKATSNTDETLRFAAHKQEARSLLDKLQLLPKTHFEEVAWKEVHSTLHTLPKMFQLFAGKQVFGVSAVLANLSKQKEYAHLGDKCPSCSICKETTSHLLFCREIGRVRCLRKLIFQITDWMDKVGTTTALSDLITDFLLLKGELSHSGHNVYIPPQYSDLIRSQETIGWKHSMEGMVSREFTLLERSDILSSRSKLSQEAWIQGLITRLIEATHGIWIYRNITMHDNISGLIATKGKEQLIEEIEKQIEQGGEGLAENDRWMLEIDPSQLEHTSGEREQYWLIAIQTARAHFHLTQSHT